MIRFKVKLRSKKGVISEDFMNADNEEQLNMISKMQGVEVVEILEQQDLNFESVANIKLDENLLDENGMLKPMTIEQQAMAELAAETNPELAAQLPQSSRPMKLDSQGNLISSPPPQQQQQHPQTAVTPGPPAAKEVHFVDKSSGVAYKVVNNVVYKKDWVQCEADDFKIIRKSSGRLIATEELIICKLDWVEMEEETEEEVDEVKEENNE